MNTLEISSSGSSLNCSAYSFRKLIRSDIQMEWSEKRKHWRAIMRKRWFETWEKEWEEKKSYRGCVTNYGSTISYMTHSIHMEKWKMSNLIILLQKKNSMLFHQLVVFHLPNTTHTQTCQYFTCKLIWSSSSTLPASIHLCRQCLGSVRFDFRIHWFQVGAELFAFQCHRLLYLHTYTVHTSLRTYNPPLFQYKSAEKCLPHHLSLQHTPVHMTFPFCLHRNHFLMPFFMCTPFVFHSIPKKWAKHCAIWWVGGGVCNATAKQMRKWW